jgi:DtxR family Mn-dependent transcriptional regulator
LDRLVEFIEFVQMCPRAGSTWLENFDEYRRHGRDPDKCSDRMKKFSDEFKDKIDTIDSEKEDKDGVQKG